MKKLIAISVVFVLLASAAFADVTIGGLAHGQAVLASGSSVEDTDPMSGGWHQGRLYGSFTNDEGTFGAYVRVQSNATWWQPAAFAYSWWQPIPQVKLQVGQDFDGAIARDFLVGWGYNWNDAEDYVASAGYSYINGLGRSTGFYGGWDVAGSLLTLSPIDGLAVNLAIPFGGGTTEDMFKKLVAQITYNIDGVGEAAFTFQSGLGYEFIPSWQEEVGTGFVNVNPGTGVVTPGQLWDGNDIEIPVYGGWVGGPIEDPSKIYLSFFLTALDGMAVNIGLAYTLPYQVKYTNWQGSFDYTVNSPIEIGLGFAMNQWSSEAFRLNARIGAALGGSKVHKGVDTAFDDPLELGLSIMPSYDVGPFIFYFNVGIGLTAETTELKEKGMVIRPKADSVFGWYVNPYITKSVGGGTFFAGVTLESDGSKDAKDKAIITWAVPIGLQVAF